MVINLLTYWSSFICSFTWTGIKVVPAMCWDMICQNNPNPFDEEEVNPFSGLLSFLKLWRKKKSQEKWKRKIWKSEGFYQYKSWELSSQNYEGMPQGWKKMVCYGVQIFWDFDWQCRRKAERVHLGEMQRNNFLD